MTLFEYIHARLETKAGLLLPPKARYKLKDLERSEWSNEFEMLMRNRLLMGALRYGLLGAPGKEVYDRVSSIHKRLILYQQSGNKEHLVDIANLCLCEFVDCHHPLKHINSQDEHKHHVSKY